MNLKSRKLDFIFLFLILINSCFISAIEFEINSEFSQGETLLAKVSGNFIDQITSQNVLLYQEHTRVAFEPTVQKIEDSFYISGSLLGKSEGNYSLVVEGVKYSSLMQVKSDDIVIPFLINNQTADFLVEPRFLETGKNFLVKVTNLKDKKLDVTSSFGKISKTVQLNYEETREIEVLIPSITPQGWNNLTLSSENTEYLIPIYVNSLSPFNSNVESCDKKLVKFEISGLILESLITNTETTRFFYAFNPCEEDFDSTNLSVSDNLKDYIKLKESQIDLESNSSKKIELEISVGSQAKEINGEIIFQTESGESALPIFFSSIADFIPENPTDPKEEPPVTEEPEEPIIPSSIYSCKDLGGDVCKETDTCSSKNLKQTIEGNLCCIGGKCEKKGDPSATPNNPNKIVGGVLLGLMALILGWFFLKKYKGTKRPLDLLKIAKK